ncbi:gephyrin-like molybdotransferase Glp [Chloroflexota bacterium]
MCSIERAATSSTRMISVEEALQRILSQIDRLDSEEKPILECQRQVLSADVWSDIDIPPMDNSAMDGFAVRVQDTCGARPVSPALLRVIGQVAAGSVCSHVVEQGTAVRIMTGASLPAGADAVVPFEDTDEPSRNGQMETLSHVGVLVETKQGANVRRRGEDLAQGQLALRKGTMLRPAEIGVLASIGVARVSVVRRPVVAVLSTGDELAPVDEPLAPGKIHDANSYTIAALVQCYGGIPKIIGIGRDSAQSLHDLLDRALDTDMLVTSGGVSLGDYDMVKNVLADRGDMDLWTVCMKPGKPSAFGVIRRGNGKPGLPHLGLPGNPVSAMVTFEQFARPAILKMLGQEAFGKPTVRAIIEDRVINTDGRRIFARAFVRRVEDVYKARLTGPQGSAILTSMAKANGLAIVPETVSQVNPGDTVDVQMLDWNESHILPEEAS